MRGRIGIVLGMAVLAMTAPAALATSYASGIVHVSGSTYQFDLNQDAGNVIINRFGDTPLNLGALSAGAHTFDIGAGTGFDIEVYSSAASGWTQISDDSLTQSKYYSPRGVTIDTRPGSPYFGRIYVGEAVGGTTNGRTTTDGIYVMNAYQGDALGQGDTAFAGGIDWATGGSNSPFKLSLNMTDATDQMLFIGDWSDGHSGVWTADTGNMGAAFSEFLDNTGRAADGIVLENLGAGPGDLHGSVAGMWIEGAGADRKLYTVDEDVRRGNILRYDVGTAVAGYATAPADQTLDQTENGALVGWIMNGLMDVVHDEDGTWWIAQYRYTDTDDVPALSRWNDGATDPVWKSGPSTVALDVAYGSLDLHGENDLIVMGSRGGKIYVLDVSDPDNPVLVDTIIHAGSYIRDVAFDAAGNIYAVSSSSETLRIYSPGGDWVATTGSDGNFTLIPEPAALALLGLGLALLRRR